MGAKASRTVDGKRYYPACVLCCDLVWQEGKWWLPGTRGDYWAENPCPLCKAEHARKSHQQ